MKGQKILFAAVTIFLFLPPATLPASSDDSRHVRNVILMIGDGMGIPHATLARWYGGGSPLAMDEWTCGLVRTYGANTPLTDSAPAATAYATGFKSFTGFVGVMPFQATMWGIDPRLQTDPECRPLVTLLEAARLSGKATGLVVTCELPHATPAAFSAHHIHRSDYEAILMQQVYNQFDVVLAGGWHYLQPKTRLDGENLAESLRGLGYTVIRSGKELAAASPGKTWGMFAERDIACDLDRTPDTPSLEEMTRKAIALLQGRAEGFLLMVEGSKIDWAAHANDPVGVVSELLAFDRAVAAAVEFARRDGQTAVIVVADHECGGLSIGDRAGESKAETSGLSRYVDPLRRAVRTGEGVEKSILASGRLTDADLAEQIRELYGLELTPAERSAVMAYFAQRKPGHYGLDAVIGPMLSARAHLGWTTSGHTGADVALHVFHPRGFRPTGLVQNTAVAWYVDEIMGLGLEKWNRELFLPPQQVFAGQNATITIESRPKSFPVLVVKRGDTTLRFPANRNLASVNGRWQELKTLVVHNGMGFFLSREAADLLRQGKN